MKNLFFALVFAVSMLLSLNGQARPSQPLQASQHVDLVASGSGAAAVQKVHDSIVAAGASRGWHPTADQPGKMTLSNTIRGKFVVVIDVSYDAKGLTATYVSSENLNYAMRDGVAYIHPKYNAWVATLLQDIARNVAP